MKLISLLAVGMLAALLVGCSGDEGDTIVQSGGAVNNGIAVSGVGRVSAAPDVAILTVGVTVERPQLEDARNTAASAMQGVVNALKAGGVADKDIQTTQFSVQPMYDYFGRPSLRGYQVSNVVTAKLRKLDDAGKVIDAAVKAGGNDAIVQGIRFTIDDTTKLEAQAREAAMKQAKERAEQLAKTGGVDLGKAVSITEGTQGVPVYQLDGAIRAPNTGEDVSTTIQAGELDVVVTVQVVYAIG